jgi:Ferritin-like domain
MGRGTCCEQHLRRRLQACFSRPCVDLPKLQRSPAGGSITASVAFRGPWCWREATGTPARAPRAMLRELMEDNKHIAEAMRKAHKLDDDQEDSGTAGLLETFIDEIERRIWFLFEASPQEGSNEA